MSEKKNQKGVDWRLQVASTLIVLGLLAGLVALAWHGMGQVSGDGARAWALVATLLLPVALWAGWRLGHTEAKGRLQGIDDGLEKVVSAASKAIDLRVQSISRTRQATQEPTPYVVLPPPEPAFRMRAPQLTEGEMVELE